MQYKKYFPSPPLQDFVECYYTWHTAKYQAVRVDSPPSAFTAIVINLGAPHSIVNDDGCTKELPQSFITGQAVRNYAIRVDENTHQLGIVLKPTGLFHLFGVPLYEFTNERLDLRSIGPTDFRDIEEKLLTLDDDLTRIKFLESILLKILSNRDYSRDGVDIAADQILSSYGNVRVTNLLQQAFMSRRKFERHFFKKVGLSPKYYARIRRFGFLCSMMAGSRQVQWNQLLHRVGYYDQSHFIRDFREFSGSSPTKYLETNLELAHFIKPEILRV